MTRKIYRRGAEFAERPESLLSLRALRLCVSLGHEVVSHSYSSNSQSTVDRMASVGTAAGTVNWSNELEDS